MRVPLASVLICLSLTGVGRAATDQEKRRLHVPYVRSATSCIVEQVRRDLRPNYSAADVSTTINSAIPECREALNRMVDRHDRIFGAGTGRKFLEGPYLHDLPRAIAARIEPRSSSAVTEILTLTGSCRRHFANEIDRTPSCARLLLNTNYADGLLGFYFVSDGTAITFSGLGNEQVKPHADRAVQPIDLVIVGAEGRYARLKAVGQCEFSNPQYRESHINCRAVTDTGVFEGAFVSDGTPPQPFDLRSRPEGQVIYNDHTLLPHESQGAAGAVLSGREGSSGLQDASVHDLRSNAVSRKFGSAEHRGPGLRGALANSTAQDDDLRSVGLHAHRWGSAKQGTNRFSGTAALAREFTWYAGSRGGSTCLDIDAGSSGRPVLEVTLCAEAASLKLQLKRHAEDPYGMGALEPTEAVALGRIVLHARSHPSLVWSSFQTTSGDGFAIFTSLPNSGLGTQDAAPPERLSFEFEGTRGRFSFEAELPEEIGLFLAQQVRIISVPPS